MVKRGIDKDLGIEEIGVMVTKTEENGTVCGCEELNREMKGTIGVRLGKRSEERFPR